MTTRRYTARTREALLDGFGTLPGSPPATALAFLCLLLGGLSTSIVFGIAVGAQIAVLVVALALTLALLMGRRASPTWPGALSLPSLTRGLESLAAAAVATAVLTSTWNGLQIDPLYVASGRWAEPIISTDALFLFAGAILVLLALVSRTWSRPPVWIWVPALLLVIPVAAEAIAPFQSTIDDLDLGRESLAILGRRGGALDGLLNLEIALLVIPVTVAWTAARSTEAVRLLAALWLASAAIGAGVALTDHFDLSSIGTATGTVGFDGRQPGLSAQANHLALGAALVLPIALMGLFEAGTSRRRVGFATILGLLAFAILVSGSRVGLVVGVLGALYTAYVFSGRRGLGRAALGLAVVLIAVVAIEAARPGGAETSLDRLFSSSESANASSESRRELRALAFDEFSERPIAGVGYGSVNTAHLIYLQLLHSGGAIALAAFLLFATGALRLGWSLSKPSKHGARDAQLAAVLTGCFALFLVAGLASNALTDGYPYVPVGLLLGLVAQPRGSATRRSPGETGGP